MEVVAGRLPVAIPMAVGTFGVASASAAGGPVKSDGSGVQWRGREMQQSLLFLLIDDGVNF